MSLIEAEVKKMEETTSEEKYTNKKNYSFPPPATEYKPPTTPKKPRRPVWEGLKDTDQLTDPGDIAVAERRRFLKQLQEGVARTKENQVGEEVQQQWKAMKERRQRPRKIGLGLKILEFLSQPTGELRRLREVEQQSPEAHKDMLKDAGKRLRGAGGFLRGLAAAVFKGVGGVSTRAGERIEPKPTSRNSSTTGGRGLRPI